MLNLLISVLTVFYQGLEWLICGRNLIIRLAGGITALAPVVLCVIILYVSGYVMAHAVGALMRSIIHMVDNHNNKSTSRY